MLYAAIRGHNSELGAGVGGRDVVWGQGQGSGQGQGVPLGFFSHVGVTKIICNPRVTNRRSPAGEKRDPKRTTSIHNTGSPTYGKCIWEWRKNEITTIQHVQLHEYNARYEVPAYNVICLVRAYILTHFIRSALIRLTAWNIEYSIHVYYSQYVSLMMLTSCWLLARRGHIWYDMYDVLYLVCLRGGVQGEKGLLRTKRRTPDQQYILYII